MDILNEKIEGLVKKAEKSGMPYGILKKVYDRGMAAWKTGHRPGTTPQQWAFARVNSFITKSSGTWGKADKDLAKQVRGEEVERRKTASEMLGQVKEKLPKDADAGDYVKDFRKSDAPQFKGKSDKKKQKMAIAAYLDSKEEKDLDEALKFKYAVVNTSKNNEVVAMSSDEKDMKDTMSRRRKEGSLKVVKLKRPTTNDSMIGYPLKEEVELEEGQAGRFRSAGAELERYAKKSGRMDKNDFIKAAGMMKKGDSHGLVKFVKSLDTEPRDYVIQTVKRAVGKDLTQKMFSVKIKEENCPDCDEDPCKCKPLQESGHTDVPSMKTQVQIAMDALQKMNTELGKLSDEEELPTWWTNKVATAVGKLDGMADYIDAKHDQGDKMNEDNITEERVFVVRFEKEGMRFAVPFSDMKRAKDGEKILKKSAGVSNVSVTKDILKPGVKFKRTQEGKIVAESKMGELFLDMQMDAQEMSERDFIKTYSKQGFQAAELKKMHKEFNEEVEKVDNSLMAQATRVISHTSIREKIDPADIDVKATAADRKAADKNIIIQLRRAQDMEKQTGRADQSGIEFLDKKKQKVDPKIINKALDMFDKMKPNDKAKMQSTIGKSYRDLLKTVQRGRIWNTLTQKRTVLKKQSLRL
mgnify:CR=1 FL=1